MARKIKFYLSPVPSDENDRRASRLFIIYCGREEYLNIYWIVRQKEMTLPTLIRDLERYWRVLRSVGVEMELDEALKKFLQANKVFYEGVSLEDEFKVILDKKRLTLFGTNLEAEPFFL